MSTSSVMVRDLKDQPFDFLTLAPGQFRGTNRSPPVDQTLHAMQDEGAEPAANSLLADREDFRDVSDRLAIGKRDEGVCAPDEAGGMVGVRLLRSLTAGLAGLTAKCDPHNGRVLLPIEWML